MRLNIKLLLLTIFLATDLFAQALPIRNDTPTTLRDLGADLNVGRNFAVNQYGQMQCTLAAGTSTATNPIKLRNGVATDGDAGIQALGVRNESASDLGVANLDYSPFAVTRSGAIEVQINAGFNGTSTNLDLLKLEDAVAGSGDAGVAALYLSGSVVTASAASGDYINPQTDTGGRTIVINAPAGETFYACTGTINTATNTSLKALVASNRHYVTSFSCTPQDTSPNQIFLTDGSGGTVMDYLNTVSNAVAPGPQHTFPTPLRGTSDTALFVQTSTTASIRCCASGYISTI